MEAEWPKSSRLLPSHAMARASPCVDGSSAFTSPDLQEALPLQICIMTIQILVVLRFIGPENGEAGHSAALKSWTHKGRSCSTTGPYYPMKSLSI